MNSSDHINIMFTHCHTQVISENVGNLIIFREKVLDLRSKSVCVILPAYNFFHARLSGNKTISAGSCCRKAPNQNDTGCCIKVTSTSLKYHKRQLTFCGIAHV